MKVKILGLMVFLAMIVAGLPIQAQAQGQNQAQAQAPKQFPIAVVDVNRVFRDSKQGQAIDKKLKADGSKLETDMKSKDDALKKIYDALIADAQAGRGTREALEAREKELQTKLQAFQEERSKAIDKMNSDAEAALKPLQAKTEKAIEDLAQQKNFVMVINSGAVVYAPNSIDITSDIIAAVDKK
jgi:Outer membrane protein